MEFIELEVWIKNRELTNAIYVLTKKFPPDELYGIIRQMRRAANVKNSLMVLLIILKSLI